MNVIPPYIPGNMPRPALKESHKVSRALPFSIRTLDQLLIDGPHWHDFPQLWYTISGTYTQTVNGEKIIQTPGSLLLIHPFTIHSVDASDIDLEAIRVISVNIYEDLQSKNIMPYQPLNYASSAFDKLLLSPYNSLSGKEKECADILFEEIYAEFSRKLDMNTDKIYRNISRVFELMLRKTPEELSFIKLQRAKEQLEIIKTATEFINENATRELTLSELSKVSFMSQRSFGEKFRECTGQTFHTFYNNIRMKSVIRLMRFSELPLADIAAECGFYDVSHMRHVIKNATGFSPLELRAYMLERSHTYGESFFQRYMSTLSWLNVMSDEEIEIAHNNIIGVIDPRWKFK
ncbi:MAG: helix-turn-helix domain-containing protein [Oscillospiraceae bacterium]|nr:helix-turn-helix domain-containing protein [Oscillospiraceae bacterium]